MKSAPLLVCLLLLCGVANAREPRQLLDRGTGATLTLAAAPWVHARERPLVAANVRDYAALQAVDINTSGRHASYLVVFRWSTIDRRGSDGAFKGRLLLQVDDRQLRLEPAASDPRELGISRWPLELPGKGAQWQLYRVDPTVLRQMADSQHIGLSFPDETEPDLLPFTPWRSGQAELAAFMAAVAPG